MTGSADHEGLAAPVGHQLRPLGLWPPRLVKVCEFADVVHLYVAGVLADLAPAAQQAGDQLSAADVRGGIAVGEDRSQR